jgi:hypothetical protein
VRYIADGLEADENNNEICADHEQYQFPGLTALQKSADGSWRAVWPSVPAELVTYSVFVRETEGSYDESNPFVAGTEAVSAQLPQLSLLAERCVWVRANYPPGAEFADTNERELCSGANDRATYSGIESLAENVNGSYTITWPKASVPGTRYHVYGRAASASYEFSNPLVANTDQLSHTTENLALSGSQCFMVRAVYADGSEISDENVNELCTDDPGIVDFDGCSGVTPVDASSVRVDFSWPDRADEMVVIRNGSIIFATTSKSVTTHTVRDLASGVASEFQCGARRKGLTLNGQQALTAAPLSIQDFSSYQGCVSGTALGVNQIEVRFLWPSSDQLKGQSASEVRIQRSGVTVGNVTEQSTSVFIDTNLQDGATYSYACTAVISGLEVVGSRRLTDLKTLRANPPLFDGIVEVAQTTGSSVSLTWSPILKESVVVDRFFVYGNPGTSVDVNAVPLAELQPAVYQHTVNGIGEELIYSFAVKACTSVLEDGASRLCAWGRIGSEPVTNLSASQQKQITLPDTGPPQTIGATAAAMSDGSAMIIAPWSHSLGALSKRIVFYKQGPPSANAADYTTSRVFNVSNPAAPPTTLSVNGLS